MGNPDTADVQIPVGMRGRTAFGTVFYSLLFGVGTVSQ
jgi:hypothetical protein